MKNNVVFFFVDSVFSDCLGTQKTGFSSTPEIDKMIKEGFYASSVFSYGPYTDAATKGLYCGEKTLDNYGYYFEFNFPNENIYKTFKDNDYETYGYYYPYNIYGNKIEKNIDHSIFTSGFLFESEFDRKYQLYAERKKENMITEIEYRILIKETDLLFNAWNRFYENMNLKKESSLIINKWKTGAGGGWKKLKKEKNKYFRNKKKYINEMLDQGHNHCLFTINEYNLDSCIDKRILKRFYKKNWKFFFEISKKEFLLNLKNNRLNIKEMINNRKYIALYFYLFFASTYTRNRSLKKGWRLNCSGGTQVDTFLKLLDDRKESKPFYVQFDTEEPHNNISFFSYDTKDENTLLSEIEYLYPLVKNIDSNYSGNITYQLALNYVDLQIKKLKEGLEKRGLLDSTTIIISADHGSSYAIGNIRGNTVNNFHTENYKTPLIIWNAKNGDYNIKNESFYQAEDVLPTILNALCLNIPSQYKGKDMAKDSGRDYVITEYMGPGVPDMITRDVWLSIRDKNYVIAFKQNISSDLDTFSPIEIYDLINDPSEKENVVGKIPYNLRIKYLIAQAKKRFIDIQANANEILSDIDNYSVI